MYQVNQVGFHPLVDYFMYSSGSEGSLCFWNINTKDKINGYNFREIPITASDISSDGKVFVYALGYDWSNGVWKLNDVKYRPGIFTHVFVQKDVKK